MEKIQKCPFEKQKMIKFRPYIHRISTENNDRLKSQKCQISDLTYRIPAENCAP